VSSDQVVEREVRGRRRERQGRRQRAHRIDRDHRQKGMKLTRTRSVDCAASFTLCFAFLSLQRHPCHEWVQFGHHDLKYLPILSLFEDRLLMYHHNYVQIGFFSLFNFLFPFPLIFYSMTPFFPCDWDAIFERESLCDVSPVIIVPTKLKC
jgi:hypothetical protein